jgi:RNA polymerase primary sigma factor
MNFYYTEMKKKALLTREQELELGRRVQAGDESAREEMILANLRLVVTIANQFNFRGVPVDDLIEEGNIGLMEAVDRFDPGNGARFSTYAAWWIKHSIRQALHSQSRTIRVPSNIRDLSQKISRVAETMQCESGTEAGIAEIAEGVGIKASKLQHIRNALRPIQSLDAPADETGEAGPIADVIPDENAVLPDEAAANREALCQLVEVMQCLSERQRNILTWRFGLSRGETLTLGEISSRLGVSGERVRQLQDRALQKLRQEFSKLYQEVPSRSANIVQGTFHQDAIPA